MQDAKEAVMGAGMSVKEQMSSRPTVCGTVAVRAVVQPSDKARAEFGQKTSGLRRGLGVLVEQPPAGLGVLP
jgi:hypothetical protein